MKRHVWVRKTKPCPYQPGHVEATIVCEGCGAAGTRAGSPASQEEWVPDSDLWRRSMVMMEVVEDCDLEKIRQEQREAERLEYCRKRTRGIIRGFTDQLKSAVSGVSVEAKEPANPEGFWYLSIRKDGCLIIVNWMPYLGFGVTSVADESSPLIGNGNVFPDKFFSNQWTTSNLGGKLKITGGGDPGASRQVIQLIARLLQKAN